MTCDGQGTAWVFEHSHIYLRAMYEYIFLIGAFGRSNPKNLHNIINHTIYFFIVMFWHVSLISPDTSKEFGNDVI